MSRPFSDARVASCFAGHTPAVRSAMLVLRELIFDVAAQNPDIGRLTETLRWGQPSYLTEQTRSGSTVRIGVASETMVALYFICTTGLVDEFREYYGDELDFSRNRAIILDAGDPLPTEALGHCVGLALTYHLRRKRGIST